ncbi:MAG: cellulase family glycosylhydrolase [Ignavibacteria bacterium]|nr:cellulase family glycosylhydrolase [Ignavibacteria bacterium]MDH7526565.1 cellulase family glycosylhydrolase [Ignavibacteria bacterium]
MLKVSKNYFFILSLVLIIFFNPEYLFSVGFLKVKGKVIVDGTGQEFYLKGIGLGGWLLQEGYMLHTSGFANAQWQIRQKIVDLIGEANTEIFYETYRRNFIRKIDIDSIKAWGFNSIRLPFHWNLFAVNTNPPQFINKGFEIIDSLLAWCEANQLYLILDMHAAPGGQSDENISDYNPAYPSLWQSEQNKDLTVKIWRKIAERYKDKEWIGGYDLLNEPKWNLPPNNQPLRDLYIRITDTIRAVDTNHIIFIEGNWFATDFTGLTPPWDNNMVYSFHKYWNSNDQGSIQYLIDIRNQYNVPLWLGETGENSNKWFVDCVELMKRNNIGWAWWTWKKIETIAGPLSAVMSPFYQTLLNYWSGSGPRPSATYAFNALMMQAENLKFELCEFRKDVIDALMRQPNNTQTIPYNQNIIPGTIYATEYDLGKLNYAYYDVDYQNVGGGTWNSGGKFRNDGVDIENCIDFGSNGYNVGWIQNGEWLRYTCNITQSGTYKIKINVASMNTGGQILLRLDGLVLGGLINVPNTNGWQNWQFVELNNVYLPQGIHQLEARFFNGGFNLSHFEFELLSTDVQEKDLLPKDFELKQNYPNPFNSKTVITYSIPEITNIKLKVYDLLGNETFTIDEGLKSPGIYLEEFDAHNLSSGTYFLRLETEKKTFIRKMIILK